ncbi:hypothetical protein LP085_07900 [Achromobacter sp. MY14]|uniref:hypothetical protein n=1 Tax=unclassified Achromobacter TaxID=2626865 RepID=UPI001E60F628|nr:hypothetical protein [Achromobacter sp. MY14]MCD0496770.1 hypothetical protein [Achromobacter sp. MY14]
MSSTEKNLTFAAISLCIFMVFFEPMILSHVNTYDFAFYLVMALALYLSYLKDKLRTKESE